MDAALIRFIWLRARNCREYCQLPQALDDRTFEIDHIISKKHGGETVANNLALSCFRCNSFKGSDIGGRDPKSHQFGPLFNPRRHKWHRHFRWDGPYLIGLTPVGRITVSVLQINDDLRVQLREELIDEGAFPPW